MLADLYHFTCDHGREALGEYGHLQPARKLAGEVIPADWWPSEFVWLTTATVPQVAALGLTRQLASCDRTAYRYRVTSPLVCERWTDVRHLVPDPDLLEDTPGARPELWWVSTFPVSVVYDPIRPDRRGAGGAC